MGGFGGADRLKFGGGKAKLKTSRGAWGVRTMWCHHGSVVLLLVFFMGSALADAATLYGEEPAAIVAPSLHPGAFEPLPLLSIKPAGWLKDQLRLQASGLSGHLDEFWPDIKDSAWFGGKAEGWERVPYWLDGVVPLAYLLDDPRLLAKVRKSVDSILEHQQPDGWLGPVGDSQKHRPYDVWPLFPFSRPSRNITRPPATRELSLRS